MDPQELAERKSLHRALHFSQHLCFLVQLRRHAIDDTAVVEITETLLQKADKDEVPEAEECELSPQEHLRGLEIFHRLDGDSNGRLEREELIAIHGGDVDGLMHSLDADSDGKINIGEWDAFFLRLKRARGALVCHLPGRRRTSADCFVHVQVLSHFMTYLERSIRAAEKLMHQMRREVIRSSAHPRLT